MDDTNKASQVVGSQASLEMSSLGGIVWSDSHQRAGIAPHANNSGLSHPINLQNWNQRPSHSQPSLFDGLPPLFPIAFGESSPSPFSDPASRDTPSDARLAGSTARMVQPAATIKDLGDGRPRKGRHRRSSSDIPLGLWASCSEKPAQQLVKRESEWNRGETGRVDGSGDAVDDLFNAYMNLDNFGPCAEDKELTSGASGSKTTGGGSDNEVESCGNTIAANRSVSGDVVPTVRHLRSVSMDSYIEGMRLDDESQKIPPLGGQRSDLPLNLEVLKGEFSEPELRKIQENEKLTELALSDPKRAKRILANRQSAARSKERKMRYIAELEHKVQALQTEATTLSAHVTMLQRDSSGLKNQNNELKFRLQAMEQQARLKDALNEALATEVHRLKQSSGGETQLANHIVQQLSIDPILYSHNLFCQQPPNESSKTES